MNIDTITANLPSRDFDKTCAFYQKMGFTRKYQDAYWMIMTRGSLIIEFFPFVDLDPYNSSFSACVRVRDVDALYKDWQMAALPTTDIPRMTKVQDEPWGMRGFALVDLDGSLLRVMEPID